MVESFDGETRKALEQLIKLRSWKFKLTSRSLGYRVLLLLSAVFCVVALLALVLKYLGGDSGVMPRALGLFSAAVMEFCGCLFLFSDSPIVAKLLSSRFDVLANQGWERDHNVSEAHKMLSFVADTLHELDAYLVVEIDNLKHRDMFVYLGVVLTILALIFSAIEKIPVFQDYMSIVAVVTLVLSFCFVLFVKFGFSRLKRYEFERRILALAISHLGLAEIQELE